MTSQDRFALRVGVMERRSIVDERIVRNPRTLRIGSAIGNDLQTTEARAPNSHTLFVYRSGRYALKLRNDMTARLNVHGVTTDFGSVVVSGGRKETEVPIDEDTRGHVCFGTTKILFEFVRIPPEPVRPPLPSHLRAGPLLFVSNVVGVGGVMGLALALSLIGHVLWAGYLVNRVPPRPRPNALELIEDELVDVVQSTPEREVPPERNESLAEAEREVRTNTTSAAVASPRELAPDASNDSQRLEEQAELNSAELRTGDAYDDRIREAQENIRTATALGALVRAREDGVGPMLGLVTETSERSIADTLARQSAAGMGTQSTVIVATSALSTTTVADTGRLSTAGERGSAVADAAVVSATTSEEARAPVQPTVREARTRSAGQGALDSAELADTLRRGREDVTRCYERELALDPDLGGRLVVELVVAEDGRVDRVEVRENTLNETVGRCVDGRVRRWRFGAPSGGAVTLQVPYILTGS